MLLFWKDNMAYIDRYNGKGWLYAASNKGQEGLVKIGMTYRLDGTWKNEDRKISDKEHQLSTSSQYHHHIFHSVKVKNCFDTEQELHRALERRFRRHKRKTKRGHTNSELFWIKKKNYPDLIKIINRYGEGQKRKLFINLPKLNIPIKLSTILILLAVIILFTSFQNTITTQNTQNYKISSSYADVDLSESFDEPSLEPVIETFQFEFQKRIMTDDEIIAEVNAQIDKYKARASPMRERNVYYLAKSWDLDTELTSTPTSHPRSYSIFTETIDGKTVQIEFKTDGSGTMVGASNYEIFIS